MEDIELGRTFAYNQNRVRTAELAGEVLFCLTDVSDVLGLSNAYRQVSGQEGVHAIHTQTKGGPQRIIFITEPVLYRLIFKSKKDEAILFQKWVFDVVLPQIKKTGRYEIPRDLRVESSKRRNLLTEAWMQNGVNKPHEYINLTKQEYKSLNFPDGVKKDVMTKEQILTLSALESFEALNLYHNPKDGYYECKGSVIESGKLIVRAIEDRKKAIK